MATFNYWGVDPTENYESRHEIQADTEYEERKMSETEQKVLEYMRQFTYVDLWEVNGAAQKGYAYALWEDPEEYQLSYGECVLAQDIAEKFVEECGFITDADGYIVDSKPYDHPEIDEIPF